MNDLHRKLASTALLLAAGLATSCDDRISECVPGKQDACACPGGTEGVQVCRDDETYGPCSCDGTGTGWSGSGSGSSESGGLPGSSTDAGAVGPGAGAGGSSGSGAGTGGGPPAATPTAISSGTDRLIEVFATADRAIVVLQGEVRLLDLAGSVVATWPAPRPVTAAAFDGTTLAIADSAVLHTLTPVLEPVASVDLVESCVDLALLSGPRIVCGPENDWDRIFYTYDGLGTLLATSAPYTYNGRPMRRVPGVDEFITVTDDLSPSDFHLYGLAGNGAATYVNESPYHGDFQITDVYAFLGVPATHVVTDTGLLLLIHGPDCVLGGPYGAQCFVKDGVLGTLSEGKVFRGMSSTADGQGMYGVTDAGMSWIPCEEGCTIQRIDLAQKMVTGELAVTLDPEWHVLLAPVPDREAVLVGINRAPASYDEPSPGHRVDLVAF